MAKYYGKIGYGLSVETEPGVWITNIKERPYYGDIFKNTRRWQNAGSEQVNDNLSISNTISIVADQFAYNHIHEIRYIELFNTRWIVSDIDVQYPRLILSVGGVYNGEVPKEDTNE